MTRLLIAATVLAAFAVPGAHAQQANGAGRVLFTPAPLGTTAGGFDRESLTPPHLTPAPVATVPAPKTRPTLARRQAANPPPTKRSRLSKVDFSRIGSALGGSGRAAVIRDVKPQPVDFSRGVDLGGMSLGLNTGPGEGGGGNGNLLSPEAKDPIPTDPTIVKKGSPFLGLSLSAPTN